MSTIIAKAFDVTKKIARTIFKGSPNLFTTSDLNRQLEALKYQADLAQIFTPVYTNGSVSATCSWNNGVLACTASIVGTEAYAAGCKFTGMSNRNWAHSFPDASPGSGGFFTTMYAVLIADIREISYNDDPDHNIAGAKFMDGTSAAAANQVIYENPRFEVYSHSEVIARLMENGGGSSKIVAILAKIRYGRYNNSYEGTNIVGMSDVQANYVTTVSPAITIEPVLHNKDYWFKKAADDFNRNLQNGESFSQSIMKLSSNLGVSITQVNQRIGIEETARSDGDNTLAGLISQEATARANADTALWDNFPLVVEGDLWVHPHVTGGVDEVVGTYRAQCIAGIVFVEFTITGRENVGKALKKGNIGWLYPAGLKETYPIDSLSPDVINHKYIPVTLSMYGAVGSTDLDGRDFAKQLYAYISNIGVSESDAIYKITCKGNGIAYNHSSDIAVDYSNLDAYSSIVGQFWYRAYPDWSEPDASDGGQGNAGGGSGGGNAGSGGNS